MQTGAGGLRLNRMSALIYLLRVWAAWSRAIMARLDNVVLVCGGGAEALDVLVGDGAAAAVHCTLFACSV